MHTHTHHHTLIHTHTHICARAHAHIYAHKHTITHLYTHTHIYIHTHTHIYTHTHTHKRLNRSESQQPTDVHCSSNISTTEPSVTIAVKYKGCLKPVGMVSVPLDGDKMIHYST